MGKNEVRKKYDRVVAYIKENGGAYSQWYVGVTDNWEYSLFTEHKLPNKKYKWWIVLTKCSSNIVAREVEEALYKLGCDGEPSDKDENARYVYTYLKGSMTNP